MKLGRFFFTVLTIAMHLHLSAETESSQPSNQPEKKPDEVKADNKEPAKDEKKEDKKDDKKEDDKKDDKKADEPKSPHTFTANVSLVSDYRFRGISQTMRKPAIQGGFDYSHTTGLYLGTWGSNVDGTCNFYNNTSMEWDWYGGYKHKLFQCLYPELTYTVGVIYYLYPGGISFQPHGVRYNTFEYLVELTYKWIDVKFSQTLSNYFGVSSRDPAFNWERNLPDPANGSSRGSIYMEASLTFELCKKLTLLLHAGREHVRHYHHLSYTDWRVTLTREFDWFSAFMTYVGTDANPDYYDVPNHSFHPKTHSLGAQGFVFGISKSI